MQRTALRSACLWAGSAAGLVAATYAAMAGWSWFRFGRPAPARDAQKDVLLDRFIPAFDIVERHSIVVNAPADDVFAAAAAIDLQGPALIRLIFNTRSWLLNGKMDPDRKERALLAELRSIGWGTLAEVPQREIVMGAVTQPWAGKPVFHALPPDEFLAWNEPDFVKIVWTLRVDPLGLDKSVFRTETRALATDIQARSHFRRYWSFVSPGVAMIRKLILRPLKATAERQYRQRISGPTAPREQEVFN